MRSDGSQRRLPPAARGGGTPRRVWGYRDHVPRAGRENADLSAKYAALRKLQRKEKECVEAMQTLMGYTEEHIAEMAELVAEQRWGELEDCVARWEDARGK